MKGILRGWVFVPLWLMVTACDPFSEGDALLHTYHQRLAHVLALEPQKLEPIPRSPLPRPRERVLTPPTHRINLLTFLDLQGCDLQVLVAERNSGLGRVMDPLVRLQYESHFLAAASTCVALHPALSDTHPLRSIWAEKQTELGLHVWNATWGSREFAHFMSHAKGFLPLEPTTLSEYAADLAMLNTLTDTLFSAPNDALFRELTAVHQRWSTQALAGQTLNAIALAIPILNASSDLLVAALERPLCPAARPTQQARQLQAFFSTVFVQKLHPYLATIQRAEQALFDPLADFATQHTAWIPDSSRTFIAEQIDPQHPSGLWQQYHLALRTHLQHWQALLDACGLGLPTSVPPQGGSSQSVDNTVE